MWNIVRRNNERCVLADVAGCLFGTMLDGERAEATEIDVIAVSETALDRGHKLLNNCKNSCFLDADLFGNLRYYFCFCQDFSI